MTNIKDEIIDIRSLLKKHVDSLIEEELGLIKKLGFDIVQSDGTINEEYLKFHNGFPDLPDEDKKKEYERYEEKFKHVKPYGTTYEEFLKFHDKFPDLPDEDKKEEYERYEGYKYLELKYEKYLKFNDDIPNCFRKGREKYNDKCRDFLKKFINADESRSKCDNNCIARIEKCLRNPNKKSDDIKNDELKEIEKHIHSHGDNNNCHGNIKCENGIIEISNLRFKEKVNLDYGNFTQALKFENCIFEKGLSLHHTKLPALELTNAIIKAKDKDTKTEDKNSDLYAINLMGTECGHIKIEDSYIDGGVTAINAAIKGKFKIINSIITACNEKKDAIHANDIKVNGSFILEDSLILGSTSMRRAKIKGRIRMLGSLFFENNQSGHSLDLRDGDIGGDVLIGIDDNHKEKESPCFIGRLIMKDIVIKGSLICSKGVFIGLDETKISIDLSGSEINGSFRIRNNAKAKGTLNIERADIGGNWGCRDSKFIGYPKEHKQWAIKAHNATIKGSVYFNCSKKDKKSPAEELDKKDTEGFYAIGCIGMSGIHIEGKWDCDGANINPGCYKGKFGALLAILAENVSVDGDVSFSQGFNSNYGRVNIININIQGNFNCNECEMGSLRMQGSKIGGEFNLRRKISPNSINSYSIVANGATIGGSVHIRGIEVYDIQMNSILVKGNMLMGEIDFYSFCAVGAKILGHFDWINEDHSAIDIEKNKEKLKNEIDVVGLRVIISHIRRQLLPIMKSIVPDLCVHDKKEEIKEKYINIVNIQSLQASRIAIRNVNIDVNNIENDKKLQFNMEDVKTQYLVLNNVILTGLDFFARAVQSPVISIEGGKFREIDLCESNAQKINFRKNGTGETKQPPVISEGIFLNNIHVSDGVSLNIKSENEEDDNIKSKSIRERIKYICSKEFWRAAPVKKKKTANIELEDAKIGDHLVTNKDTLNDATINLKGCDYATYKVLEKDNDDSLAAESKNTLPPKEAGECLIKAIDDYCDEKSKEVKEEQRKKKKQIEQDIFEELSGARNQVVQATGRMGHEEAARNLLYRIFENKETKNKFFILFSCVFTLLYCTYIYKNSQFDWSWMSLIDIFSVTLIDTFSVIYLSIIAIIALYILVKVPFEHFQRFPTSVMFLFIPLSFIFLIPSSDNVTLILFYISYVVLTLLLLGKRISVFFYIHFRHSLIALSIIILCSAFIYDHAGREGRMVPSAIIQASPKYTNQNSNDIDKPLPEDTGKPFINYQTFNPLLYSLDVFIPFFSLQQETSWQPNVCRPEQERQVGQKQKLLNSSRLNTPYSARGVPKINAWLEIQFPEIHSWLKPKVDWVLKPLSSNCKIDIWGWRYWATYIMEVIFGWLLTGAMILHMTKLRRFVKGGDSS